MQKKQNHSRKNADMLRTIDSPGIQINEIDKSQYDGMPDYSIVGTTCFICGFADKGENYTIKWINTLQTLVDNYGYPQTEEERYFWNACVEVLNNGGVCLASKLPYDNPSLGTLPYVDYNISHLRYCNDPSHNRYNALSTIDKSLTSFIEISQPLGSKYSGYMSIEDYDRYIVNNANVKKDTLRIVEIKNQSYEMTEVGAPEKVDGVWLTSWNKCECLGILPVIVSPINALFYQQVLSTDTSIKEISSTNIVKISPYAQQKGILTSVGRTLSGVDYVKYDYDASCIGPNPENPEENILLSVISSANNASSYVAVTSFLEGGTNAIVDSEGNYIPFKGEQWDSRLGAAFISSDIQTIATGQSEEYTDNIALYTTIKDIDTVQDEDHPNALGLNIDAMNFSQQLCSTTINDYTVSKDAASHFPTIGYDEFTKLDSSALKYIGIVVYKVMKDPASPQRIQFQLQESFIGSLDRQAKNQFGQTMFIDNVVNSQSNLIRCFSNIEKLKTQRILEDGTLTPYTASKHEMASFYAVAPQIGIILGQYQSRCGKKINYKTSILKALTIIHDIAQDKNRYNIDLVVDAGLANIAQAYYYDTSKYDRSLRYDVNGDTLKSMELSINSNAAIARAQTIGWQTVLQKYDTFCKNMRQDCMFIADGLRPFCLDGEQNIVRDTAPSNTINNSIIPKLKHMAVMNTSYGAGYCDWFKGVDAWSGYPMWIPPSIKAAGIYLFTDAFFSNWDAPAGMTRGIVRNVVDCAFSPNQEESGRIYTQCWNYACNYPIDGIIIEGQKTFQRKQTAFDRVNVRRLFLYLEKQVVRIARYFVYEGNTAWQRQRFVDQIKPLFETAKQRNGIVEYYIKCDEDNNTTNVIENNELRCSIAVKPVKTIEFILLNFVCTNQSASVSEEALAAT